jgi:hypothetical protein
VTAVNEKNQVQKVIISAYIQTYISIYNHMYVYMNRCIIASICIHVYKLIYTAIYLYMCIYDKTEKNQVQKVINICRDMYSYVCMYRCIIASIFIHVNK